MLDLISSMPVLAFVFAVVFLARDVQILAIRDRTTPLRLVGYAVLIITAAVVMAVWAPVRSAMPYAWTTRGFALTALLIQFAELAAAFALKKFAMGQHCWIGCLLPAPAFLVVLLTMSISLSNRFAGLTRADAIGIATGFWLVLVGGVVMLCAWMDNPWEDRSFATDYALMTSCTALIFVPFGFF